MFILIKYLNHLCKLLIMKASISEWMKLLIKRPRFYKRTLSMFYMTLIIYLLGYEGHRP
jgi:hypothetical protein